MSIKKNFLYNVSYQLLTMLLPLFTAPYIARVIGAEGVGVYSYSSSIANYFVLFAMLGLVNYGNRTISQVRDNKQLLSQTFFNIYGLQLITSLITIVGYVFYINTFVTENRVIFYIQLLLIIATILDINWFFFGLEQFKLTVTRNTIIKLLTVGCIFIFVKDSNDLWIYTVIMAGGTLLSQLMLWFFIKKYVYFRMPTVKGICSHLRPNLVLFIPVLAVSIYKIMDKIMLGSMTNMAEVAYYENSEKIINIPMGIIAALGTVMLPRMSNLIATGNDKKAMQMIEMSLKFIMFLAIGIAGGVIIVSPNFIPLFLGDEFVNAIPVVSLLAFTVIFISWANVIRTQYLIPHQKDKIYIKSTLLGALVNVISNIIFIPFYGAVGAAIGTIFAEATVAIYQTVKVRNALEIRKYLINTMIYIGPAIIMYIVGNLISLKLSSAIGTICIQIILGGSIYLILTGLMVLLVDKEIRVKFNKYFLEKYSNTK
ncbi:flippase [Turicibacter bilis]|uniref:Flippase n=1 Tax=Turicibacter bilis TaxID=2735723 RepID=A0ABY5JLP2_9FIRM|nr:flippase [Turicibacter bilis]MBS3200943.1 flippase [Turicibacter bilis]UUF07119.1 flippase [Turicibacter bilis]